MVHRWCTLQWLQSWNLRRQPLGTPAPSTLKDRGYQIKHDQTRDVFGPQYCEAVSLGWVGIAQFATRCVLYDYANEQEHRCQGKREKCGIGLETDRDVWAGDGSLDRCESEKVDRDMEARRSVMWRRWRGQCGGWDPMSPCGLVLRPPLRHNCTPISCI